MFIKQMSVAATLAAAAGFASAGTVDFDFNSMRANLVNITAGSASDFGTASFTGDLVLAADANTVLNSILFEGNSVLPAPIAPDSFDMTLSLDGLDVTGGTISFGDGSSTYTANIDAVVGTVSYSAGVDTFTIQAATSGGTTGLLNIFGQLLELDGDGAVVTFDLLGSAIRTGTDPNTFVDLSLDGAVVPTPTAAAAGLSALGVLALRRRRNA